MNAYKLIHTMFGVLLTAGFIALLAVHANLAAAGFVGLVAVANFVFAAES